MDSTLELAVYCVSISRSKVGRTLELAVYCVSISG